MRIIEWKPIKDFEGYFINELEKYCKEMAHIEENELIAMNDFEEVYIDVLDKIKELKGSEKE